MTPVRKLKMCTIIIIRLCAGSIKHVKIIIPTANDVMVPNLNGQTSYLSYPTIINAFAVTSIYIEIRPYSPDGLLLYNGQASGIDYIALVLRNGFVELWFDFGQGPTTIVSSTSISLEQWHSVRVLREGRRGVLTVDSDAPVEGTSQNTFSGLQLDTSLFIGGTPYFTGLPSELNIRTALNGCVRQLSTREDNTPTDLLLDAIAGADVGECPGLTPCETSQCQNGGVCMNIADSFACECPSEYSGRFCETRVCLSSDPCQNNGVCSIQSASNGSLVPTCACSLPYGGVYCTERQSFDNAFVSATGYLEYGIDSLSAGVVQS